VRLEELGEFGLIARIADAVGMAQRPVVVGIGDDAAVLEVSADGYLLVTTDACLEGQHFQRRWLTAVRIGQRATAAALSDIAAMGGEALAVFVSQQPWLRSTAQPGDVLLVTGTLGEAAAALHLLRTNRVENADGLPPALRQRFTRPVPRFAVARCLQHLPQPPCAIDISDGLVQDAAHIAQASGVALTIQADRIPVGEACYQVATEVEADALHWALTSGEEYELLLAIPRNLVEQVRALTEAEGVELTEIGFVSAGEGVTVVNAKGSEIELNRGGWDHFANHPE